MYVYDNTVDDFILQRLREQSFLVYLSLLFVRMQNTKNICLANFETCSTTKNIRVKCARKFRCSRFICHFVMPRLFQSGKKSSTLNCQFVVDDYIGETNIQISFDTKNIETKTSTNYYWVFLFKLPMLNPVQIVQMISCYRNLYSLFIVKCFTIV